MISNIKEKNSTQSSHPLTLIFHERVDIKIVIRLKQLLELEQPSLLLKFTHAETNHIKEALPFIEQEKHPILHKFISILA
jgi:hypothetical protein